MIKLSYLYVKIAPSGLKYLGITSRNPFKYLGSGKYWLRHLKKHKYGLTEICTEIILSTEDDQELVDKSLYYSKLWNIVKDKNWANLMPESGICSTLGRECSEETRKKISESNKGKICSEETKAKLRAKPIYFGYKHTEENKQKLRNLKLGTTLSQKTRRKISQANKGSTNEKLHKKVFKYDLDGNFIREYKSVTFAAEENDILICDISYAALGNKYTAGNFQWRYEKEEYINKFDRLEYNKNLSKIVYQYNKNGDFVKEWQGTKEPSEELKISRSAIRNNLVGIAKSAGGFVWNYIKAKEIKK